MSLQAARLQPGPGRGAPGRPAPIPCPPRPPRRPSPPCPPRPPRRPRRPCARAGGRRRLHGLLERRAHHVPGLRPDVRGPEEAQRARRGQRAAELESRRMSWAGAAGRAGGWARWGVLGGAARTWLGFACGGDGHRPGMEDGGRPMSGCAAGGGWGAVRPGPDSQTGRATGVLKYSQIGNRSTATIASECCPRLSRA